MFKKRFCSVRAKPQADLCVFMLSDNACEFAVWIQQIIILAFQYKYCTNVMF